MSDQNYVMKICDAFSDDSEQGNRVVEIGPGPGALTRVLYPRYPQMTALEIDQRAVAFLGEKLPGLSVRHMDVLEADWPQMAVDRGTVVAGVRCVVCGVWCAVCGVRWLVAGDWWLGRIVGVVATLLDNRECGVCISR